MKQVEIIQNANGLRVNEWLKKNINKNIIDIRHSVGANNNIVVMIIYEVEA